MPMASCWQGVVASQVNTKQPCPQAQAPLQAVWAAGDATACGDRDVVAKQRSGETQTLPELPCLSPKDRRQLGCMRRAVRHVTCRDRHP